MKKIGKEMEIKMVLALGKCTYWELRVLVFFCFWPGNIPYPCQEVSSYFLLLSWTPDLVKFISAQGPFNFCLMRLVVSECLIDTQLCTACIHLPEKGHCTRKDCQGQPWWHFWESSIPSSGRKHQQLTSWWMVRGMTTKGAERTGVLF